MQRENRRNRNGFFTLFLIALCVGYLLSPSAYSSEWCFVASSKNHYYYVDSETLSVYGKEITFWIVQQDIESGRVSYQKQFTINCEDETVALRETKRFGLSGALRDIFVDERYDEWAEIRAQSKMHAVQNILCCDSKPRQHLVEYLQKTTVKKPDFMVSSDVLSDKN
jgi:hypothetical protein